MGADTNLLKGTVSENPEQREVDVQQFLAMFLRELVAEQKTECGDAGNTHVAEQGGC